MKITRSLFLILLLASGFAQAQKPDRPRPLPMPMPAAWPQNFNVANNAPASFNVVVDKPAQVVVTVQFTGSPINITLTRPNGQKTVVRANTSPGRLDAPAAASETTPGMKWSLEIATAPAVFTLPSPGLPPPPKPQTNPTASGSVSVALNPPVSAPAPAPAPKPVITGLSKNPVKPGEELIITGHGFGSGQNGSTQVLLTASPANQVSSKSVNAMDWSDTRIRIIVPVYNGLADHLVGLKTRFSPHNGDWIESPLVALTILRPPVPHCFAYHTRGDGAWQIACYPGADVCNANRSSWLAGKSSVEALGCAPEIHCYSFGDRVNNGPFAFKLNACFATTAACEADRKGRVILLGGKDSTCGRFSHAGPPGKR